MLYEVITDAKQFAGGVLVGVVGNGLANGLGDAQRHGLGAFGQGHEELVAADAGQHVGPPHLLAHQRGDRTEHFVAGRMPAGVVDDLESYNFV